MSKDSRKQTLVWSAFTAANGLAILALFFNPIGAVAAGACLAVAVLAAVGVGHILALSAAVPVGALIGLAVWFGAGGTW